MTESEKQARELAKKWLKDTVNWLEGDYDYEELITILVAYGSKCRSDAPGSSGSFQEWFAKSDFPPKSAMTVKEVIEMSEAYGQAEYLRGLREGREDAAQMCDRWQEIYKDDVSQRLADAIRKKIRASAIRQSDTKEE